ncbi:MAG: ASCH domain-containing protein [Planctomycetaceae bacterium]
MTDPVDHDHDRIALAVQQPWAELIVRGIKTIEIRSTSARVRGPIYLYASRKPSQLPDAAVAAERFGLDVDALPRGILIGQADLAESRPAKADDAAAACVTAERLAGRTAWRFANPKKFSEPLAVRFLPYGIWFYPFRRRKGGRRG